MGPRNPGHAGVPVAIASALLLAACAQTPMGPMVQVMPGPGKSFEAFQYDQASCKQFSQQAVAGQAENANMRGVGAAALTTALGAGLGAAIGGGRGAGIGAAGGALGGAGIGATTSSNEQLSIQAQYDNAFSQCMYAKGEMVPGYGPMMVQPQLAYAPAYDAKLVSAVQVQLVRLGYLHDAADGAFGPRTSTAIGQFESASGLPVDGIPSPPLLSHLHATP